MTVSIMPRCMDMRGYRKRTGHGSSGSSRITPIFTCPYGASRIPSILLDGAGALRPTTLPAIGVLSMQVSVGT